MILSLLQEKVAVEAPMLGGRTRQANYYQKVSNVLIAVMMSSKETDVVDVRSTLGSFWAGVLKVNDLDVPCVCTLKVLTNIAVGLTLPC